MSVAQNTPSTSLMLEASRNWMAFRMLSYMRRPSPTADDDCGKIIVRQHHVRHVFRHVRSRDAHADADIGRFNGGRVVHAVARHRGNGSASLPRLDDTRFVLRLNAGVHAVFRDLPAELLIAKACPARRR